MCKWYVLHTWNLGKTYTCLSNVIYQSVLPVGLLNQWRLEPAFSGYMYNCIR